MEDKYKTIRKLFALTDKTPEDIDNIIKKKEQEIITANPNWSDEQIFEQLATSIFTQRKQAASDLGGEDWILEINYFTISRDWTEKHHAICEKKAKADLQKAIATGYVKVPEWNPDGSPKEIIHLYYWKTKKNKEKNKMFGRKLPDMAHLRRVGGIALRLSDADEGFSRFEMIISGKLADPTSDEYRKFQLNKMLNVKASFVKESDGIYELRARSSTYFNEDNDEYEITPDDIRSIYDDEYVPLMDVEEFFESNIDDESEHKRKSYKICVSKCLVVGIEPASGDTSARVYVDDVPVITNGQIDLTQCRGMHDENGNELKPYLSWWNNEIPLDFGVESIIYLFYSMTQQEKKDGDEYTGEWDQVTFSTKGCFVIKRVEKDSVPLKSDEVEVTEEFIPDLEELEGDNSITIETEQEEESVEDEDEEIEIEGEIDF